MPIRVRIYLSIAAVVLLGLYGARRFVFGESRAARPVETGHREIAIPLPPFTLTNQDAKSVTREDLRGKVTIVDFIFTKCPSICPRLTQKMSALAQQAKADEGIRFISISVDPDNDTPSVLRSYGEKYGADFSRWSFLTGDQKAMEDAVVRGFKVAYQKDEAGSIAHAERFVLVDDAAIIRGYFDADETSQRRLLEAARALAD